MGRKLKGALVVSVALNVFLAGFVAGRIIGDEGDKTSRRIEFAAGAPYGMLRHSSSLPPDSRDIMRREFRNALPEMREIKAETMRLRRELNDLLAAPTFDQQAISEKMRAVRAARDRQHVIYDNAFLEAIASLSPDDRRRLIEAAKQRRLERDSRRRCVGADCPSR